MPIPQKNIKQKIVELAISLVQPLQGEQGFRDIRRVRTLFQLASVRPALHIVTGPEVVIDEDERGYMLEFPIFFKLMIEDAREIEDACDRLVGKIQEKIEANPQLNGSDPDAALASKLTYDGEQPFGDEILKPEGGSVVAYVVQYRRYRGEPKSTY